MTAMLHCLVGDIADELRAALPNGWAPANDEDNAKLIDALTAARLLDDAELMALLLRRADEERIGSAARARNGRREARTLHGLVSVDHGPVSAAAMALILARGRRRDRFGQCLLAFEDLSPASAHAIVHATAAALRCDLAAGHGVAAADTELSRAANAILGGIDRERSVERLSAVLVRLLDESGELTEDLLLAAAHEGEVGFLADALARRSGIEASSAFDELLSGDTARVMTLIRAAGLSREASAALLAAVADLIGIDDPGEAIGMFDSMSDLWVNAARSWLLTAPTYRAAIDRLGTGHGQRPL